MGDLWDVWVEFVKKPTFPFIIAGSVTVGVLFAARLNDSGARIFVAVVSGVIAYVLIELQRRGLIAYEEWRAKKGP